MCIKYFSAFGLKETTAFGMQTTIYICIYFARHLACSEEPGNYPAGLCINTLLEQLDKLLEQLAVF